MNRLHVPASPAARERRAPATPPRGRSVKGHDLQPARCAAPALAKARAALRSGGEPLSAALREAVGSRLGQDFSGVRVHADTLAGDAARALGARAFTFGRDIVLADRGLARDGRLMAHELAHVAQVGKAPPTEPHGVSEPGCATEREADGAATSVLNGQPGRVNAAPAGLLMPDPAPQAAPPMPAGPFSVPAEPPPTAKFETAVAKATLGAADAHAAIDLFRQISTTALRQLVFNNQHAKGNISKLLRALSPVDLQHYRAEVQQLLRWVQESETRVASGLDDDKMARKQATFVEAEARKQADAAIKAATPKGVKPKAATAADVASARKKQVEATSIPPSAATGWAAMSGGEQGKWKARGAAAVKQVVAHARKLAPELKVADADFLADFPGVESRGAGVLAYGQGGGPRGTLAVFGYEFVKSVEADPAYVMDVVVHEMFGHPEYGTYGSEYHLDLYDKSMAKVAGYVKPGGAGRQTEIDAYAYQETEIYSLLRGFAYHKDLAKADQGRGLVTVDAPNWVASRIGLMKAQWEPSLANAVLRGLYQRLRLDARITPAALKLFADGVKSQFDAATAAAILK